MGRIGRGLRLAGISWRILGSEPGLLVLPLLSFVAIAASGGLMFLVGQWTGVGVTLRTTHASPGQLGLLLAFYVLSSLGTVFFNAALIAAATVRLDGGDPTLGGALRVAASRWRAIVGWALVSATVGLVIRTLEDRVPFVARIVAGIAGLVWGAATFFVVPVLVFERRGIAPSVRRSTELVRRRWGEGLAGSGLIVGALFTVMLPITVASAALMVISIPLGVTVIVVMFLGLMAVSGALSAIFDAALYRYATTETIPDLWSEDDLRAAFRPRRIRDRRASRGVTR